MKIKWRFLSLLALTVFLMFSNAAYAFEDLNSDEPSSAKIEALQQQGIISGFADGTFRPQGSLTYGQAVYMLVKGFGLNIDNLRFIREPKASDTFENVPDDAWYAQAFIIAFHSGLPIPKDVDPEQPIVKMDYADLLYHALSAAGNYTFTQMYINVADEDNIPKEKMNSIQVLLNGHIVSLDEDQRFHPEAAITRGESAVMLYNALEIVKKQESRPPRPGSNGDVTVDIAKVNDQVNRVTLAWGEKPNTCYQISVTKIEFEANQANVYYKLQTPQPGTMCGQMVVHPQAVTYVDSQYQVQIREQTNPSAVPPVHGPANPEQPVSTFPAAG